jgi:endonuclease YncB( thermonuclease family)
MNLFIFLICSVLVSGCANSKVYIDPSEVEGLGAVVRFPAGSIVPIRLKRVLSGSAIELTNKEQVSYIGIYIPDIENIPEHSRLLNNSLVADDDIRLEFDSQQRDAQGRLLAYVFTSDAKLVNAELVKAGFARALIRPPNDKYKQRILEAEQDARDNKRGLWLLGADQPGIQERGIAY